MSKNKPPKKTKKSNDPGPDWIRDYPVYVQLPEIELGITTPMKSIAIRVTAPTTGEAHGLAQHYYKLMMKERKDILDL